MLKVRWIWQSLFVYTGYTKPSGANYGFIGSLIVLIGYRTSTDLANVLSCFVIICVDSEIQHIRRQLSWKGLNKDTFMLIVLEDEGADMMSDPNYLLIADPANHLQSSFSSFSLFDVTISEPLWVKQRAEDGLRDQFGFFFGCTIIIEHSAVHYPAVYQPTASTFYVVLGCQTGGNYESVSANSSRSCSTWAGRDPAPSSPCWTSLHLPPDHIPDGTRRPKLCW